METEKYKIVDMQSPGRAITYGDNAINLEQMINDGMVMSIKSLAVVRTDTNEVVGGTKWIRDLVAERGAYTLDELTKVVKEKRWEI